MNSFQIAQKSLQRESLSALKPNKIEEEKRLEKLNKIEEQKNLKELKNKFVEKLKRIEELDKKKNYLQRQGQRKSKFLP